MEPEGATEGSRAGGPLIVAGMHRSGTSFFARLLHGAGLFLGEDLGEPTPSNPHGYFEDVELSRFHTAVLQRLGLNWQVTEAISPAPTEEERSFIAAAARARNARAPWGFKDPRVCFFLETWKAILPETTVVIIYRDYGDVTWSLERRHGRHLIVGTGPPPRKSHRRFFEQPDHALRMWQAHNEALLRFAARYPDETLVVSFDRIARGAPVVAWVRERWGLPLEDPSLGDTYDEAIVGSRPGPQPVVDPALADRVAATWEELEARSEPRSLDEPEQVAPATFEVVDPDRWLLSMDRNLRMWEAAWARDHGAPPDRKRSARAAPENGDGDAERDPVGLLQRLGRSPLGPILRLSGRYRALERRWSSGR